MAGFIGTFKRKETKYVLDAKQIAQVKQMLSGRMRVDDYGVTRIDSLYFDTPNRSIISRSLEKPLYKEKLRVRSYGDARKDSPVFVELKKKYKGIVYKRRVRMSRAGADAYLKGMPFEDAQSSYPIEGVVAEPTDVDVQIAHEIDAFRSRYEDLAPSMVISCMREAWQAVDPNDPETDVRITFDEAISYVDVADERFDYESAVAREGYDFAISAGSAVMEIKCAGAYPLWLVQLLDACDAYPKSFSKYGMAYRFVMAKQAASSVERRARHARNDRQRVAASSPTNVSAWRLGFSAFRGRKALTGRAS
jgi:hypothetical protein